VANAAAPVKAVVVVGTDGVATLVPFTLGEPGKPLDADGAVVIGGSGTTGGMTLLVAKIVVLGAIVLVIGITVVISEQPGHGTETKVELKTVVVPGIVDTIVVGTGAPGMVIEVAGHVVVYRVVYRVEVDVLVVVYTVPLEV
jgi:hypothetical protein